MSGWSITGYQVKTGHQHPGPSPQRLNTSTTTSAHYCTPNITYPGDPRVVGARWAGTPTSAESEPVTITVTDPVDCTYPSRTTSGDGQPGRIGDR